jgi:uncharacterized protein
MSHSFQQTQFNFTQYLRDPEACALPDNIPPERMQIYVELIYNNIEGFISGAFPVLRSIIPDQQWHKLVRDFIKSHFAQTPYFLQISQEFLTYLLQNSHSLVKDFPFMIALAHYEWVELALDVAEDELHEATEWPEDPLAAKIQLSPLTMILSYPWPVHQLSPDFTPSISAGDTHLLVYRNREDQIQFMELSAVSSRLLQLCRDNPQTSLEHQLQALRQEVGASIPDSQIIPFLQQLHQLEIVFFYLSSN